mmetsp:Transcript_26507/g.46197  ORF Transcript_26507/g.46197 Transcript_26507/m.46197 type:complete len:491 (-) Transcript_26507:91-1563(-)
MSLYRNMCYMLKGYGAKPPVELSNYFTVALYLVLLAIWYVARHVLLALGVGLFPWQHFTCDVEQLAMRLDGTGTVIGFCTASALMQAFAAFQQMGRDTEHEDWYVIGSPILCFIAMYYVLRIANVIRDWIANSGDGVSDTEAAWGAYIDFSENKGVSLALSHTTVQAIRFYLSGREYCGVVGDRPKHLGTPTLYEVGMLLLSGTVFTILCWSSMALPKRLGRFKQWCKMACSLCVAWCNLYSMEYFFDHAFPSKSAFNQMCSTCANTVVGAMLMFALTKLIDVFSRRGKTQAAFMVQDLFIPISVLIGFSWRNAFQEAMHHISDEYPAVAPPHVTLIAAIFMLILVAPAWYKWILPTTFKKWVPSEKQSVICDSLDSVFEPPFWLNHEIKKAQWHANPNMKLTQALKDEMFAIGYDFRHMEEDLVHVVKRGGASGLDVAKKASQRVFESFHRQAASQQRAQKVQSAPTLLVEDQPSPTSGCPTWFSRHAT